MLRAAQPVRRAMRAAVACSPAVDRSANEHRDRVAWEGLVASGLCKGESAALMNGISGDSSPGHTVCLPLLFGSRWATRELPRDWTRRVRRNPANASTERRNLSEKDVFPSLT